MKNSHSVNILLSLLFIAFVAVGCVILFKPEKNKPKEIPSTVKRVVRPIYGVNNNLRVVREVDTLFSKGDTIRVNLEGISTVNEAVIIK